MFTYLKEHIQQIRAQPQNCKIVIYIKVMENGMEMKMLEHLNVMDMKVFEIVTRLISIV